MDDRMKNLWADLEAYIQENWVAPDEETLAAGMLCEDESPYVVKREDLSGPVWKQEKAEEDFDRKASAYREKDLELDFKKKRKQEELFSKEMILSPNANPSISLEDLIGEVGEPFHEVLFEKILQSGMTDVEVYRRANMDRKLFSKIRNNPAYHPGKNTVLALAIALKMNIDDTQDLLSRAEYALSPSSKSDVIIRYFIERKIFDIDLINIALDDHNLTILG